MKKLLLIATGGTIACQDSGRGLTSKIGAKALLQYIPDIARRYELKIMQIYNIDSPDIQPHQWEKLVREIRENYDEYIGFVIIHGTDTLAFTSSALSYMIQNSRKPIVVTGSQYPIDHEKTDGVKNLADSCIFAAESGMPGVYVVFNGKVMFGNHVKKIKSKSYDAFYSVNYPDIATVVDGMVVKHKRIADPCMPVNFTECVEDKIFILKFYPGIRPAYFSFIKDTFKAVVIEGYGVAGIPSEFIPLLQEWNEYGIEMVVTSQSMYEGTDLEVYSVGRAITNKFHVMQGCDMTLEAVWTKLMYILSSTTKTEEIRKKFYASVQEDWSANISN